ncbi:MAG: alpha/beta hydrolase [Candidatus Kapaibacterium sp.]
MITSIFRIAGLAALSIISASILHAQPEPVGHWDGALNMMGQEMTIAVDISRAGDSLRATIDVPQQGGYGLKLQNVSYHPPELHFELPSGLGTAAFDGKRKGDSISGGFMQGSHKGEFVLKLGPPRKDSTPVVAVPYREEEVHFSNDTIALAGTLTLPRTGAPHPAVIMITGSGPQNRDEELFNFRPFRIIADRLTRNGIAVLRYDDRGTGESKGTFAGSTTADFATDARAALKFLKGRPDIDPKQIGFIGHSEGGIIAPIVAAEGNDVAFIVLMAGTGVKGGELLKAQVMAILKSNGAPQTEIDQALQFQEKLQAAIRTGKGMDEVAASLRSNIAKSLGNLTPERLKAIGDTTRYLDQAVAGQLKFAETPWYRYFIDLDPAVALEKVKCPVLILFGDLDVQVPAEMNKGGIVAALKKGGNSAYTVKTFPKANHLFLTAKTGSPSEYAMMKKEFVPEFLDTISSWISERAGKK